MFKVTERNADDVTHVLVRLKQEFDDCAEFCQNVNQDTLAEFERMDEALFDFFCTKQAEWEADLTNQDNW